MTSQPFSCFTETTLTINLSTRIVLSCTLHCLMWASDGSPVGGLCCVLAALPSHGAEVKAQLTSYVQQHSSACQLFFPAASHAETGPWCWEASLWIPTTRNNTISVFEQPQVHTCTDTDTHSHLETGGGCVCAAATGISQWASIAMLRRISWDVCVCE